MAIVPSWYLPLSTFQLNMVRQRKDGDSLERLDGSKPTWKVGLDVWLMWVCLHASCVLAFLTHKFHHSPPLTVIHLAAQQTQRCDYKCDVLDASKGSVKAQKPFNATFNLTFAGNPNLSLGALHDGG